MLNFAQQPNPAPATQAPHGPQVHEVRFVGFPKLLFTWPLILTGFLLSLAAHWGADPALLGWIYISVLVLVLLTLGVDVDRNQAIFWIVLLIALWTGGALLENVRNWPIFGTVYNFFAGLNVRYDSGFGLAISIMLLIPFVIMMLLARLNNRWRITHNEFEHYSFGRMDDSLGRGAKTIRTDYPDVFEMLLGMAGTLIVYNASGTRELRRIEHVMFLPWVRGKLNLILERTAVTSTTTEEEEEELS